MFYKNDFKIVIRLSVNLTLLQGPVSRVSSGPVNLISFFLCFETINGKFIIYLLTFKICGEWTDSKGKNNRNRFLFAVTRVISQQTLLILTWMD